MNTQLDRAAQFAPIIERVHGSNHPELTRVREITLDLQQTTDAARKTGLFTELRSVTQDYAVPGDVCEAFEATYRSLQQADGQHSA
jgi:iron-sulfur cluster repair protein YtfE (RIC family)